MTRPLSRDLVRRLSNGPIHEAAVLANGNAAVFHVLGHTPEQCVDIYVLLVDDQSVLRFEIERYDATITPRDVQRVHISEHRREVSGLAAKALVASLEAVLT